MGGPGFFGLKLGATARYPEEWMTLTIWGASDWLLLNEQWFSAHPRFYEMQKPVFSDFHPDQVWDEATANLVGSTIQKFEITANSFLMTLAQGGNASVLALPEDKDRLPRFGGSNEPRTWPSSDQIQDAWVFTQDTLYC